ncbi:hypothetical protein NA57DRAFT_46113 [Rhizodiscina lignyota]|uniref:Trafficking protein particle complex II-specific subunit 65 IgD3 domain-containing protein n=1 Tax=Rhizodiscina lignyota TaxID=1504668 RepID=A0A9P4M1N7_9PEZI|nr:hypothetical protein NA57DRAFT_46113 [Rhizodiscina lignyota]
MSIPTQDETATDDTDFVEGSVVEAIVPASANLSIQELFEQEDQDHDEGNPSLLAWVKQRDFLLLDESLSALLVLKTPYVEEEAIQAYLSRLSIALELYATGIGPAPKPNDPRPAPVKELLSELTVDRTNEPVVVASKARTQDGNDGEPVLFVIWNVELPLNRPRVKLHKLSVYLSPSVSLNAAAKVQEEDGTEQYLPSLVPQPINLLQPFDFDPRFAGKQPYLSSSRITKVAPAAPVTRERAQNLRAAPRRLFRAGPALFWRIRFSKTTAPPKTNSIFASLELEVTPFWPCSISIEKVDLHLMRGKVQQLGPNLPICCRPGDQFTILFKLHSSQNRGYGVSTTGLTDQLNISIKAIARISDDCTPYVNINWSTTADFSFDQKPSQAKSGDGIANGQERPRLPGPDTLPYSGEGNLDKPETPTGPTGVTVTITGPERVFVGKPFRWEVFIVNRSDVVQNLAVFPINKANGTYPNARNIPSGQDAYDMPISWFFEPSELTCLSTSARLGPLAASACSTTELKFLAAAPGVLHMDAVRVVDLNTREATDVTDLPDIVALLE